ncbi:MAG: HNH endonuclease [Verrucomicrobiales bacterium]
MAAVPAEEIVVAILDALTESGAQAQLTSRPITHPRTFQVIYDGASIPLWIYIWTITHGGATRSPEEYRIQMTTVTPPLAMNPKGRTLLLGWNPEHEVFGGFDINRHREGFRRGSNSVQISLSTLLAARSFGWGFYTNQFAEIAVAFKPAEFVNYMQNAQALHAQGARAVGVLNRVVRMEPIPAKEIAALPAPRKRIVETISRLARASNFHDQIVSAYDQRCAVTRVQLKLVDAAHILPVGAEGSTDSVRNGICLAPTYHRAFDGGLIYLTPELQMKLNETKLGKLVSLNLAGGLDQFRHYLDQEIFLPANPHQRPALEYINKANAFRRI